MYARRRKLSQKTIASPSVNSPLPRGQLISPSQPGLLFVTRPPPARRPEDRAEEDRLAAAQNFPDGRLHHGLHLAADGAHRRGVFRRLGRIPALDVKRREELRVPLRGEWHGRERPRRRQREEGPLDRKSVV